MAGIVRRSTANFSLGIPYFDTPNWGQIFERNMDIIDAVLSTVGSVSGIIGDWQTNTAYGVGDRVVDVTDNSVYEAEVAHTSGNGTFAADRAAHPTYWLPITTAVAVRGAFVTGVDYVKGDFVYDSAEYLAAFVETAFTGGVNLRANIANLGIIADFKTLATSLTSTIADVVALEAAMTAVENEVNAIQDGSFITGLTAETSFNDPDVFAFWDSVATTMRKITGANMLATVYSALGALIAADAAKATPVDADKLLLADSAASNASTHVTLTSLWTAYLKVKADAAYVAKVSQTLATFFPYDNEPTSSNYATLNVRNAHPILEFNDTTAYSAVFTGVMPATYAGGNLIVEVIGMAVATSGTMGWTAELERLDAAMDTDGDGFAAAQTITAATVPGTSGFPKSQTVTIAAGSATDSIVAGDLFRLRIKRDVANDTAVGNTQVLAVTMKEV